LCHPDMRETQVSGLFLKICQTFINNLLF